MLTAIDLWADAALLVGGAPPVRAKGTPGGFYDLGDLRALRGTLSAPARRHRLGRPAARLPFIMNVNFQSAI